MTRIRGRHKRRYRVTTDSRHKLPVAQNVLNRNFTPAEPNQVFTSDITYVWSDEGWLYHDRRAGDGVVLPPSRAPALCIIRTEAVNTRATNSSANCARTACDA